MKTDSFILPLHLVSADINLIIVYQCSLDWTLQQAAQTRLYNKQHKETQTYKQHLCIGLALLLLLPGVDAEVRDGQIRVGIHLPSVLHMLQWKILPRIRGCLQKCVG
jgi:hypothetical protein